MVSSQAVMENQFTEQFKASLKSAEPDWLRALREDAWRAFNDLGFPGPNAEDWKYTNVAPIGKERWQVAKSSASAELTDRSRALLAQFNVERNGFAALNLAFAELVVVTVPKDTKIEDPIELSFAAEANTMIAPHILVIAEAGSKATIVESYSSGVKSLTNSAVQIIVEDNANLSHYRVQKESADTFHYGVTEVSVGRGSAYNSTNINLGSALSRHDIEVKFTEEGGEAWVDGLYMLNGAQHHDTHSIIDHRVPNCTSHQNYRGVLNDKSRAVFNGKVFVREDAHGTDAQQQNKNLLLSNEARVDTKPQLEIFNDDVKCSHGATVGQLEEEELFYLLTRGLPESLARNLLTYGFAEEIINKIDVASVKAELDSMVLNRLNAEI